MPHDKRSRTRLRTPSATWQVDTIHGVRVASITPEARACILHALADCQLVPAPAPTSRGGPTFVVTSLAPGGMVARDVVISAVESGLVVIATFGLGLFGTEHTPPPDQRIALVSQRQLDLARSDSGWLVLASRGRDLVLEAS